LMICGNTDGDWLVTSQPSGVSAGAGVTGHAPAAADADAPGATEAPPLAPLPPVQAPARSATAQKMAGRVHRVMAEA